MTATRVICLGEAMIELAPSGPLPGPASVAFAGDTYNTAVYLKRAAPEISVAFATMVGTDPISDGLVTAMQAEGLDTSLVRRSQTRVPGLYAITTDSAGERSFTYWRASSAAREMFREGGLQTNDLRADLLYLSGITLAILPEDHREVLLDWLPSFRAGGGRVAFDPNYRPALWPDAETARAVLTRTWHMTDIGLPSLDDEIALFADRDAAAVLTRLRSCGVGLGALKRGAAGPLALDGEARGPYPCASRVVDSTAAGDSFNAAYIAAILQGRSEAEALKAGHALAIRVIAARGAILPRDAL